MVPDIYEFDEIKEKLGFESAKEIKDLDIVGLGTGSTTNHFIKALAKRVKEENLNITCVSTSIKTEELAKSLDLNIKNIDEVDHIDITVNSADYITVSYIIKGSRGTLLQEKFVESITHRFIIIVDYTKQLTKERVIIPIEILKISSKHTLNKLIKKGYQAEFKMENEETFVTDLGNYIINLSVKTAIKDPKTLHNKLCGLPGVIETGIFINLFTEVWIANKNDLQKQIV